MTAPQAPTLDELRRMARLAAPDAIHLLRYVVRNDNDVVPNQRVRAAGLGA